MATPEESVQELFKKTIAGSPTVALPDAARFKVAELGVMEEEKKRKEQRSMQRQISQLTEDGSFDRGDSLQRSPSSVSVRSFGQERQDSTRNVAHVQHQRRPPQQSFVPDNISETTIGSKASSQQNLFASAPIGPISGFATARAQGLGAAGARRRRRGRKRRQQHGAQLDTLSVRSLGAISNVSGASSAASRQYSLASDGWSVASVPQSLWSWDGQVHHAKNAAGQSIERPRFNIMPCQQPLEVIFARADEAVQRHDSALVLKEQQVQRARERIEDVMKARQTRAEAVAEQIRHEQRQRMWLRLLPHTRYWPALLVKYEQAQREVSIARQVNESAFAIQQVVMNWFTRRMWLRYFDFAKRVTRHRWRLAFHLRIVQKYKAGCRIRKFLEDFKEVRSFAMVISKFVYKVKQLQGYIRTFLMSNRGRVYLLSKYWDAIEQEHMQIIRRKLAAEHTMSEVPQMQHTTKQNTVMTIEFNRKIMSWRNTDAKVREILDEQRVKGNLPADRPLDWNVPHIPPSVKKDVLTKLVKQQRRQHLLKLQEDVNQTSRKRATTKVTFTTDDVKEFLFGGGMEGTGMAPKLRLMTDTRAPFLLLKSFAPGTARRAVADIYRTTYKELYGDLLLGYEPPASMPPDLLSSRAKDNASFNFDSKPCSQAVSQASSGMGMSIFNTSSAGY